MSEQNTGFHIGKSKMDYFGTVASAKGAYEIALVTLENLWNNGEIRLREEDIVSMLKNTKEIEVLNKKHREIIKKFSEITVEHCETATIKNE